jgi:hypothetical protein
MQTNTVCALSKMFFFGRVGSGKYPKSWDLLGDRGPRLYEFCNKIKENPGCQEGMNLNRIFFY